jgi:hypothetical protein
MLRAILHDLHTGDSRAPTVDDHLRTLAVTASIEASASEGIRIHVPSFAAAFGIPIPASPNYHQRTATKARHSTQSSVLSPQS